MTDSRVDRVPYGRPMDSTVTATDDPRTGRRPDPLRPVAAVAWLALGAVAMAANLAGGRRTAPRPRAGAQP